jgi:LysR family glycine cleavage system transcriptional activator
MRLRRKVPSLNALRFFDAAARRLSFTEAASELCVTQGAVSQRIKALEAERGELLFQRGKNGLALTVAGEQLAQGIREGLERIQAAWNGETESRPLRVSVLPSFAACWVVPRLPRFAERHPTTRVEVMAQGSVVDLRQGGVDLAIRFGLGRYPGLVSQCLMGDSVVPVCAPALLEQHEAPASPADLARMPILHDAPTESDNSGTDWGTWLEEVGCAHVALAKGPRFSQADLAIEAAARGLGVALARVSLVSEQLQTGRLVQLPLPAVPTAYSYHLVWRAEAGVDTQNLRHWLLSEAASAQPCEKVLH